MSPRRSRPRGSEPQEPRSSADGSSVGFGWLSEQTESYRGEDWTVRQVAGDSGKFYRCPGCDQEIRPGVGHVVAWPSSGIGGVGGVDDRRHWHRACWSARERRSTAVQRGRGAPKH
ncbi:ATP/GTP-binding protein [Streptacidiphilus sp. EB129]|uniref:ATP/GTP-binding protein n=1 Tax=Streptacidiphilus sp. EB129 TaxID=3156262 RepID=UPI00351345CD